MNVTVASRSHRLADVSVALVGALTVLGVGGLEVPAAPVLRPSIVWLALGWTPGWLWWLVGSRTVASSGHLVDVVRRQLSFGALHLLVIGGLVQLVGGGPVHARTAWLASLLVPLVLAGKLHGAGPASVRTQAARAPAALVLGGAMLAAVVLTALQPVPLALTTDGPAHLGGIQDALQADRLIPPDRSVAGNETRADPRFGILHGAWAFVSSIAAVDPVHAWQAAPIVFAPFFLLAHAALFCTLGLGPLWGAVAALLFTLGGADGRAFGLWLSGYPAQVAQALAALGLAEIVASTRDDRPTSRARWIPGLPGVALTALSTTVHVFAWWATCVLMAHALALLAFAPEGRRLARRLVRPTLMLVVLGGVLMLPRVVQSGGARESSLHWQVVDAVFVSERWFVIDPLALAQWGGFGPILVAPLALVLGRAWWRKPAFVLAIGAAVAVWTVALNPVVAPLAWATVSYLTERLGRTVWVPAIWMVALGLAWSMARGASGPGTRLRAGVVVVVSLLQLYSACASAVRGARYDGESRGDSGWAVAREVCTAMQALPGGTIVADPRTSYALRALRGGASPLYPLAHSSPLDAGLVDRLGAYRELFSPARSASRVRAALDRTGGEYLLVNLQVEQATPVGEFGYVASDSAQAGLEAWLRDGGARPVASGEAWSLYRVSDLQELRVEPSSSSHHGAASPPLPNPARLATPLRASRFQVIGVLAEHDTVALGGRLAVRVWYRIGTNPPRAAGDDWEQVHLRLQGPMPVVPGWLTPVGKLYRKLIVEDSGRSLARFGARWVPFDGTYPPSEWPDSVLSELRVISVPGHLAPGPYQLQPTVQEGTWLTRRHLRDWLRDDDRFTGEAIGEVQLVPPGQGSVPGTRP